MRPAWIRRLPNSIGYLSEPPTGGSERGARVAPYFPYAFATSAQFTTFHHAVM